MDYSWQDYVGESEVPIEANFAFNKEQYDQTALEGQGEMLIDPLPPELREILSEMTEKG